ncbi:glycosyltransferase family 2 protein [Gordoniibacillus kamchatkensis]|uniref:glycosyltransferase family 2 protein n=1 Tax=Gordoniibacillus kamchatkensis TaxID=1590651 RepID=UPI0026BE1B83
MKVLVIVPAFNERDNLPSLFKKFDELKKYIDFDVIVINDKSTDETSAICRKKNIDIIDLPCNLGIGGAVQTGYKYANLYSYDIAIQIDGDGQHNPEYINKMIDIISLNKADIVIGSRFIEKEGFQSTKLRRVGIKYFSKLINIIVGLHITDLHRVLGLAIKKLSNYLQKDTPKIFQSPNQ